MVSVSYPIPLLSSHSLSLLRTSLSFILPFTLSILPPFCSLSGTIVSCFHNRGETFQKEFLSIGEAIARSLVPDDVRMMALTVTAARTTRQQVCRRLGMVKPVLVTESPNRSNIKYIIKSADNIEETFASLVEEIRRLRRARLLSFVVRTYTMTAHVFIFF